MKIPERSTTPPPMESPEKTRSSKEKWSRKALSVSSITKTVAGIPAKCYAKLPAAARNLDKFYDASPKWFTRAKDLTETTSQLLEPITVYLPAGIELTRAYDK